MNWKAPQALQACAVREDPADGETISSLWQALQNICGEDEYVNEEGD